MSDDSEMMAKGKMFIETFSAVCVHFLLILIFKVKVKVKDNVEHEPMRPTRLELIRFL